MNETRKNDNNLCIYVNANLVQSSKQNNIKNVGKNNK